MSWRPQKATTFRICIEKKGKNERPLTRKYESQNLSPSVSIALFARVASFPRNCISLYGPSTSPFNVIKCSDTRYTSRTTGKRKKRPSVSLTQINVAFIILRINLECEKIAIFQIFSVLFPPHCLIWPKEKIKKGAKANMASVEWIQWKCRDTSALCLEWQGVTIYRSSCPAS